MKLTHTGLPLERSERDLAAADLGDGERRGRLADPERLPRLVDAGTTHRRPGPRPPGAGDESADEDAPAVALASAVGAGVGATDPASAPRHAATIPAPTSRPMTRPPPIAAFPPIATERTSTTGRRQDSRALPATIRRPWAILNTLTSRILPALLTALGVVLITAGLLTYPRPHDRRHRRRPDARRSSSCRPRWPSSRRRHRHRRRPLSPASRPRHARARRRPGRPRVATRVVVPALGIDLPIVSGNDALPVLQRRDVPHHGKKAKDDVFGQPGEGRATYIYAHARDGMFGPIYELAIQDHTPNKMLGMVIQVYTSWNRLYLYEVRAVRRHITSLDKAMSRDKEEVWLQTSEGPEGHAGQDPGHRALPVRRGLDEEGRAAQGEAGALRLTATAAGRPRSSRSGAGRRAVSAAPDRR